MSDEAGDAGQGRAIRSLYDRRNLLTEVRDGLKITTYAYDKAGNRLSKTINSVTTEYAYDDLNQLVEESSGGGGTTTDYSYDLNGNTVQKSVDDGSSTTDTAYLFDTHDRLVEATQDTGSGASTVFEAAYDYRTRRVSKTEGSDTTHFRYDGGTSFHELDAAGDLQVEFVRGGSGTGMGGGIGSILYSDRSADSGPVEYYTYNAMGHTVALTDDAGDVTKTDQYEAFGSIVTSSGTSDNNRLANTKERDASLGLDNHGFRYYDPSTGRYLTLTSTSATALLVAAHSPRASPRLQVLWQLYRPPAGSWLMSTLKASRVGLLMGRLWRRVSCILIPSIRDPTWNKPWPGATRSFDNGN